MKKTIYYCGFFLIFFSILFYGCKKKESVISPSIADENIQSTQDNAIIDGEFSNVFSYVDSQGEISFSSTQEKKSMNVPLTPRKSELIPDCATLDVDSVNKILTIDFGSSNCLCRDGIYRKGKIMIKFTGQWRTKGSNATVTLLDYYVNNKLVQGRKSITIMDINNFGPIKWNVVITNASINTNFGLISWNANRIISKIKGAETPAILIDDEYSIDGSSSGINRNNVQFSVNTETSLIKALNCTKKDFVDGILTITNLDKGVSLTIDYNPTKTRACDKIANVLLNGKVYQITLR